MTKPNDMMPIWVLLLLAVVTPTALRAQTFKSLVDFDTSNGSNPEVMSLIQGTDGNLYGTTSSLSASGGDENGTAFKMTQEGALTTIVNFDTTDEYTPTATLLQAANGNFYGTAFYGGGGRSCNYAGGCGAIFEMTPAGVVTTFYPFCSQPDCTDGQGPVGGLTQGIDGNFYGTTGQGGVNSNDCPLGCGTVFKITPAGKLTTLYAFCAESNCADGAGPGPGLVQATNGNLYGTTAGGGVPPYGGTVFEVTPEGKLTTLYSFCAEANCADGSEPIGPLVQAGDGDFYGTTEVGGSDECRSGCGTVFRITAAGRLTTVHRFTGADGAVPIGALLQGSDGKLYGITEVDGGHDAGTVFVIATTGELTTLHRFDVFDGAYPRGGLMQATSGDIYGSTYGGGSSENCAYRCGTIFGLSLGLDQFVAFMQGAGRIGQTNGILGQGFTGTTNVSFNGTPASFTVVSDTYIRATVPAGATTGYVTVTTPSGTLTSNVPFHVIP